MSDLHGNRNYAPLEIPQQPSQYQRPPPLFSFGFRNPDGSIRPVSCLEGFFPEFRAKSFVFCITILQVVIFLVTEILALFHQDVPGAFYCVVYHFGAKFTPSILIYYEVQRLILPILLHFGFLHIFMNMFSQLMFGFRLEKTYHVSRFVALYLLAGIGGNLLSAIKSPGVLSAGASSSLYGVFALQVAFLIDNFNNLGPSRRIFVIIWIVSIVANLNATVYTTPQHVGTDRIDNYAHMGGFFVGALMAVLFTKRENNVNFRKLQKLALVGLISYFIIASIVLATMNREGMQEDADSISYMCKDI